MILGGRGAFRVDRSQMTVPELRLNYRLTGSNPKTGVMSELPTTHSELPFYYCCVDTAMPSLTQIVRRFGSAIIAVLLPFLALLIEQPIATLLDIHFEIVRAVVSVACIVLLIHSGLRQRAYSRDRWEFSFWIALLGVPLLGATWLGLNVIRYYLPRLLDRQQSGEVGTGLHNAALGSKSGCRIDIGGSCLGSVRSALQNLAVTHAFVRIH